MGCCVVGRVSTQLLDAVLATAGYEHPVDTVVADLLACLDDPALALLQWTEAFNVVQARPAGLHSQ